jgi:hypothetical protein
MGVPEADCTVGPTALTKVLLKAGEEESATLAVSWLDEVQNVHTANRSVAFEVEPNCLAQLDAEPVFHVETGVCCWEIVAKADRVHSMKTQRAMLFKFHL